MADGLQERCCPSIVKQVMTIHPDHWMNGGEEEAEEEEGLGPLPKMFYLCSGTGLWSYRLEKLSNRHDAFGSVHGWINQLIYHHRLLLRLILAALLAVGRWPPSA